MSTKDQHKLMDAYKTAGGMPEVFEGKKFAHLMVHHNKIYKSNTLEGLEIDCKETSSGVDVYFRMRKGYVFDNPVYLCFGIVPKRGLQEINISGVIEDNAKLEFLAYCVFPNATSVEHRMQGKIKICNNSSFKYSEIHYHGNNGGIIVIPKLKVSLEKNSYYEGNFYLLKGRAGKINIDYDIDVGTKSRADLLAKVLASGNDDVYIKEKVTLKGKGGKGTITSRTVGKDTSKVYILSEMVALKADCVGHVDCIETILDKADAKACPLVDVRHKDAKVTHEAAIGSLNKKQMEVLMSKGLTEGEATQILINSLLR